MVFWAESNEEKAREQAFKKEIKLDRSYLKLWFEKMKRLF